MVSLGAPAVSWGQISTDGTVGPAQALPGLDTTIPESLGARAGDNLFHSFDTFAIQTGGSATFTGAPDIAHVISRVTGGDASTINGRLASEIGTEGFWFINPAGVMFGPDASIDVPAAFHVSTADQVAFADGSVFSATDPDASSLTVAPPEAFGFLGPKPAAIAVDRSELEVGPGETLSLVGGDLEITGGSLKTRVSRQEPNVAGGQVNLVAMAGSGHVAAADATPSVPTDGAVQLSDEAEVTASGNGSGTVRIRGGQVRIEGSYISAINTGDQDAKGGIDIAARDFELDSGLVSTRPIGEGAGGAIHVQATGDVSIRGTGKLVSRAGPTSDSGEIAVKTGRLFVLGNDVTDRMTAGISSEVDRGKGGHSDDIAVYAHEISLKNGAGISSFTRGEGDAANITVEAGRLSVENTAQIRSNTSGAGHARGVVVNADHLVIVGAEGLPVQTGIASRAGAESTGDAGEVHVAADALTLRGNAAQIASNTLGQGDGGHVAVTADHILIEGSDNAILRTGISSTAEGNSEGNAGNVTVRSDNLTIRGEAAEISSSTFNKGNAGNVDVYAEHVTVAGGSNHETRTGISSAAEKGSSGQGGSLHITAGAFELRDTAEIITSTDGAGNAGAVVVNAQRLSIFGADPVYDTGILSTAEKNAHGYASAGKVEVHVEDRLVQIGDKASITSGTLPGTDGAGGQVEVTAERIYLANGGNISARSEGQGDAGTLWISAGKSLVMDQGAITTEAAVGSGGQIQISVADRIDLQDSQITSSVAQGGRAGDGGDITIDPRFLVMDSSRIAANAIDGNGGDVRISFANLIRSPDSAITASSETGLAGNVILMAPDTDISGTLAVPTIEFLDAPRLLPTPCESRLNRTVSSLLTAGLGALPSDPTRLLPMPYLDSVAPVAAAHADPALLPEAAAQEPACPVQPVHQFD